MCRNEREREREASERDQTRLSARDGRRYGIEPHGILSTNFIFLLR